MIIETEKIRLPKLETSVYLEDFGEGKGKIIVDSYGYGASSHYWGAMGSDLKEFIVSINSDYFAGKLSRSEYVFSGKATAREVRRYIREELPYELPWYKYQSAQKELRKHIKEIEYLGSVEEFVSHMDWLDPGTMTYELDRDEEKEFIEVVEGHLKSEPWHFAMEDTSKEYKFLQKVHTQLKKIL